MNGHSLKQSRPLMFVVHLLILMTIGHVLYHIYLHSRPSIDMVWVMVNLGCTRMYRVLWTMSYCKKTHNHITNPRHTQEPSHPQYFTWINYGILIFNTHHFLINLLQLAFSNSLPFIRLRNIYRTSILANTPPLTKTLNCINRIARVWTSLSKGHLVTLKQAKITILIEF